MPGDARGERPADDCPALEIETVRPYRKGYLLKFQGYGDRTQAESLRDRYLLRPFEEIDDLDQGEVFYHELLGAAVVTVDGQAVGTVREVYALRPSDLLEVVRDEGSLIIPVNPEVVVRFDRDRREVLIDPPEGLLDL